MNIDILASVLIDTYKHQHEYEDGHWYNLRLVRNIMAQLTPDENSRLEYLLNTLDDGAGAEMLES